MPIDINRIRAEKGGNPEELKRSQEKRFKSPQVIDEAIALDAEWRKTRFDLEQLQKAYSQVNKEVAQRKKASKGQDPCEDLIEQVKSLDVEIQKQGEVEKAAKAALDKKVWEIGNLVHESVPVSKDEVDNRIERTWGEPVHKKINNTPGNYFHHAVLSRIDGYDSDRGVKIVGHRGYFLKGPGVMLNQALINFGVQFLSGRSYTALQPPFFMHRHMMGLTAELSDFDEQLYKVTTNDENQNEYYLVATSEQPISCMHNKEWLNPKDLPIRYAGVSSCFRKEAGAHGKDTWGIFRVHQFEKVEQFCITTPEASWEMHEEMIRTAEEFYQALKIPYRVVTIVSGELNGAAAKKYDLEGWFPGYGTYRELVSCSNCTDFQSRAIEVRCGNKKQNEAEKKYVHMLNATLCATERTMCCILENYQTEEGVIVPEVLRPYMGGREFIPYVRELTKQEAKQH